jgi:hypothetical protein
LWTVACVEMPLRQQATVLLFDPWVDVVASGLSGGIEVVGWDEFGVSVVDSDLPLAVVDESVVSAAEQDEVP